MSRIAMMVLLLVGLGTPLVGQATTVAGADRVRDVEASAMSALRAAQAQAEMSGRMISGGVGQMRVQSGARVSYSLSGRIPAVAGATPGLPAEIVNAVRDDTHLTSLNVSSRGTAMGQFTARFSFDDLAEFDAWYSTQQAQNLHRAVQSAAGPEGSVQVNLSVNSPSAAPFNFEPSAVIDPPVIVAP